MNNLFIFIGCGLGGLFRYWVSNGAYLLFGRAFPYGTLVVNVSGSFLMGLLSVFLLDRFMTLGPQFRAFLLIGLLGGYTTFSSFSIETINLFENAEWVSAAVNIVLSFSLCLIAAWIGVTLGRQL